MAAPAPAAGGAGGAGAPRVNISTIGHKLHVSVGINRTAPMYVGTLYGFYGDSKGSFDLLTKIIPKRIDSNEEMCVGLAKAFTKRSVTNAHMIFAVQGDVYTIGIYGFATVNVHKLGADDKKYFEIDAFCTKQSFKGVGKLIMNEIKKIASDPRNGITSIVLKSTPGAIPFYLSQGFRLYDTAPSADKLTRMYFNIDGSDDNSWTIIPQFSADPIVPPAAPAADPESAAAASADTPSKSAGGGRRRQRATKRSKGLAKKKYTRK
jgi:hypothetical protein